MNKINSRPVFALALLLGPIVQLHAQGTAFIYQGRLNDGNNVANGVYDFSFALDTTPATASQAGSPLTLSAVGVSNGLFTVTLDFGNAPIFAGTIYYLQTGVRTNGSTNFTLLTPRQQLTPTPYAIYATTAGNFSGAIVPGQLAGGTVASTYKFSSSQNSFTGNGSGLTGVNAGNLNGLSASNFWQASGNAETSPTNGNFLGTIDNQPMEIRVNDSRVMRYEPGTNGAPNVVGGASVNYVTPGVFGGTIAGGGASAFGKLVLANIVTGNFGSIGGGCQNVIMTNDLGATISGGYQNQIAALSAAATIGGGSFNYIGAASAAATVAGGEGNAATNYGATVGGGGFDGTNYLYNVAGGAASTVAGGLGNLAQDNFTTVGGGMQNSILSGAANATISGGYENFIGTNAIDAVIAGGDENSIDGATSIFFGSASVIGGGIENTIEADAYNSTIPGGQNNTVGAPDAFAAGYFAQAMHSGAFVWADSQGVPFTSTSEDQFLVRAQGGVGINTNNPGGAALSVNGGISSTMWKATTPINSAGPLGRSGGFTSSGGTLVMAISGSGYTPVAGAQIGMNIKLDGTIIDTCSIYANPASTHMAFVPKTIMRTGVAAGFHTIALTAYAGTSSDGGDSYCVTVQELPF